MQRVRYARGDMGSPEEWDGTLGPKWMSSGCLFGKETIKCRSERGTRRYIRHVPRGRVVVSRISRIKA